MHIARSPSSAILIFHCFLALLALLPASLFSKGHQHSRYLAMPVAQQHCVRWSCGVDGAYIGVTRGRKPLSATVVCGAPGMDAHCPVCGMSYRVLCDGQPCLPVGTSDLPGTSTVKIFCPKCEDTYYPRIDYQVGATQARVWQQRQWEAVWFTLAQHQVSTK
eukprot:GHRR01029951.1.p1 GENE.GHRR01029951.1~~GHRR01029951.1.p1  ORF type:complete len:162 (+),score=20.44 GHRR01029951.1:159-644(+)